MFLIRQFSRSILFLSFALLQPVTFAVASQSPEIKVVANTSVLSTQMSVAQIRRIFSMRQTVWPNNQPITVYVLANEHESHQIFSTKVLGMFPYQLDRIWNKLVYSGLGEEPIKVQSEQEMLELVGLNPGAIGYVMRAVDIDLVKVIAVEEE